MRRGNRGAGREVERLLRDGVDAPGGDARLLHRYRAERDESAFEALVDRHGPPVLALCRRYLRDPADVEDAFQATFLVLVRKGGDLRDGDALASWLYGVAYRVAMRARSDLLKRRAREGDREGVSVAAVEPPAPDDAIETLDRELARLPEKYRAPLVLCYLKGRTHDQAAAELGWPVGTVRSRMARARSILHDRLSRRGLDASAAFALLRADLTVASIPPSLVAATVAAGRFAGLSGWLSAFWSSSTTQWPAAALAQGVIAMSSSPWKPLGFAFACLGLTAGALAVAGSFDAPGVQDDPPRPQPPAQAPPEPEKPAAPAADVEGRLADVEQKLDRLLDQVAKPAAAAPAASSSSSPPDSSVKGVGEAIGLKPSALALTDARSLREIEAQLVSAYRKFRIIEDYLGKDHDMVSELQAQSLREDAIAPARVLVARLREMEDEASERSTAGQKVLDDAEHRHGEALKRSELLRPPYRESRGKVAESAELRGQKEVEKEKYFRALDQWLDRNGESAASAGLSIESQLYFESRRQLLEAEKEQAEMQRLKEATAPGVLQSKHRLAAVRRLITWAREHFPGVMLTIDDADAPAAR
ncbi:RNA polymerase sigma factor [Paludisphaera soli]|uniref:RNA polymerase sigma factor n=1 Tax=Paludisphaera soli TaxID=2712865 RepID=UPI0013EA4B20|nr:sigma-70 family RNA polymerase sigma factor [Paludisphaera soli]